MTIAAIRLVLLCVLCYCRSGASHPTEPCSSDEEPYHMLGDRTLYEHVGGTLPPIEDRAPEGCEPIQIYMLVRHGARYPGAHNLPKLRQLLNISQNVGQYNHPTLCKKDFQAIRNWQVYTNQYDQRNQTEYGAEEVKGVARRYKALFPELLAPNVSVNNFQFYSTDKHQTKGSLQSFVEEMMRDPGDDAATKTRIDQALIEIPPLNSDQFYDSSCKKYRPFLKNSNLYTPRYHAFGQGPVIQGIAANVARRLAIPRSSVTYALVALMYTRGCQYQQQVDAANGPWCALFTTDELKVLQFWIDLKDSEIRGPALPLALQKNCGPAKDVIRLMTSSMERDRNGGERSAAKFRTLHTSNIATMPLYLGLLGNVETLTEHNYATQKNRKFNFSKMVPTGGHLVFVLYRCSDDYKMQVFWNERVVQIPGCPESPTALCSMYRVLALYPHLVAGSQAECNQTAICGEYS